MAIIHNTDLTKELKEGARLQQLRDVIPNQLADKVVPVMEVNPKLLRRINVVEGTTRNTSGAGTVYTTPTDRDFLLNSFYFGFIKDAACDVATGSITFTAVINGATKVLANHPVITLTAQTGLIEVPLPIPIKIDRGTNIIIAAQTFAAGVMIRNAGIHGYIVDNSGA